MPNFQMGKLGPIPELSKSWHVQNNSKAAQSWQQQTWDSSGPKPQLMALWTRLETHLRHRAVKLWRQGVGILVAKSLPPAASRAR